MSTNSFLNCVCTDAELEMVKMYFDSLIPVHIHTNLFPNKQRATMNYSMTLDNVFALLSYVSFDISEPLLASHDFEHAMELMMRIIDLDIEAIPTSFGDDYSAIGRAIFALCILYGSRPDLINETCANPQYKRIICGAIADMCVVQAQDLCSANIKSNVTFGRAIVVDSKLWRAILGQIKYKGRDLYPEKLADPEEADE